MRLAEIRSASKGLRYSGKLFVNTPTVSMRLGRSRDAWFRRSASVLPLVVGLAATSCWSQEVKETTPGSAGKQPSMPRHYVHDWSLGQPRLWSYERVFPFLDGIFQDVASTTVVPLSLQPNVANASSMDAVQTSFQASFAANTVTPQQNAIIQQQNSTSLINSSMQQQLVLQQQQLLTSQIATATQAATSAQTQLQQLLASPNPDSTQVTNAQALVTSANSQLTALDTALGSLSAQISTAVVAPTALQSVTAPTATAPSLPTSLQTTTIPGGVTPSFAASKQMDNQVNTLWERLSRLVGTLVLPDNLKDYRLVLAEFKVSLNPAERPKSIFGVRYRVADPTGGNTCDGARALDLFPSAAAVNIVDNKYKDSSFGLAGTASGKMMGAAAAYNREHLAVTQGLGQSAYVTGFGAGTSQFGWMFGRNLGDDSVSPGVRTVYAILALPPNCKAFGIGSDRAGWFVEESHWWKSASPKDWYTNARYETGDVAAHYSITDTAGAGASTLTLLDLSYTPVEYDQTATANPAATLILRFRESIDSQMEISAGGRPLYRARDNFGRAISTGSAGGQLEVTSFTPTSLNTWIPTSSTSLTIALDPKLTQTGFPELIFSNPSGSVALSSMIHTQLPDSVAAKPVFNVHVAGLQFSTLNRQGLDLLPPPATPKAATRVILVSPWLQQDRTGELKALSLLISSPSDAPAALAAPGTGAMPSVQVLSDQQVWGSRVRVTVQSHESDSRLLPLDCKTQLGRLVCPVKDDDLQFDLMTNGFTIEVRDPDHAGGTALYGILSRDGCLDSTGRQITDPACQQPSLWSYSQPAWKHAESATAPDFAGQPDTLTMDLWLRNVDNTTQVTLMSGSVSVIPPTNITCPTVTSSTADNLQTCHALLQIPGYLYPSLPDRMTLQFSSTIPKQVLEGPAVVLNGIFSAAAPMVTQVSADSKSFAGQNLVFNQLQVGSDPPLGLICDYRGLACTVNGDFKNNGAISFLDATGTFPSLPKDPHPTGTVPIAVSQWQSSSKTLGAFTYTKPGANAAPSGQTDKSGNSGNFSMSLSVQGSANSPAGTPQPNTQPVPPAPSGTGSGGNAAPQPAAGSPPPPGSPAPANISTLPAGAKPGVTASQ